MPTTRVKIDRSVNPPLVVFVINEWGDMVHASLPLNESAWAALLKVIDRAKLPTNRMILPIE